MYFINKIITVFLTFIVFISLYYTINIIFKNEDYAVSIACLSAVATFSYLNIPKFLRNIIFKVLKNR